MSVLLKRDLVKHGELYTDKDSTFDFWVWKVEELDSTGALSQDHQLVVPGFSGVRCHLIVNFVIERQ